MPYVILLPCSFHGKYGGCLAVTGHFLLIREMIWIFYSVQPGCCASLFLDITDGDGTGDVQMVITNKRLAEFRLISMSEYYTERRVKC